MSADAARERLSEVRQQPVDLGEGLGVPGVVVEHEAARGNVEGCGIHGVHRRRCDAAGCRSRRRKAGPGAAQGTMGARPPVGAASAGRAAGPSGGPKPREPAAPRRRRRPCRAWGRGGPRSVPEWPRVRGEAGPGKEGRCGRPGVRGRRRRRRRAAWAGSV